MSPIELLEQPTTATPTTNTASPPVTTLTRRHTEADAIAAIIDESGCTTKMARRVLRLLRTAFQDLQVVGFFHLTPDEHQNFHRILEKTTPVNVEIPEIDSTHDIVSQVVTRGTGVLVYGKRGNHSGFELKLRRQ